MQVSRRTVYNWMRSGQLPAVKVGRTWRTTSAAYLGDKKRS